jgi:hypothetical protein
MDDHGARVVIPAEHLAARDAVIPILLYHSVPRGCSCDGGRLAVAYRRSHRHQHPPRANHTGRQE